MTKHNRDAGLDISFLYTLDFYHIHIQYFCYSDERIISKSFFISRRFYRLRRFFSNLKLFLLSQKYLQLFVILKGSKQIT